MAETRDIIRERQLLNLDDKYDKLPGSFIWETYQANAIEHENLQIAQEDGLNQKFAGTADLESLKVMAFEKGIIYKNATFATTTVKVTGVIGAIAYVGDLFANELQQYAVLEETTLDSTGTANILVECVQAGTVGNTPINTITQFPKSLNGINTVTNEVEVTNGYEAETRDNLLTRYYSQIRQVSTGGNIEDYIKWATSVSGVGTVKIKPLWNGGKTVKVVILDSNQDVATQTLIDTVAVYIETVRPLGAIITVATATELLININCKIALKQDYTLEKQLQILR